MARRKYTIAIHLMSIILLCLLAMSVFLTVFPVDTADHRYECRAVSSQSATYKTGSFIHELLKPDEPAKERFLRGCDIPSPEKLLIPIDVYALTGLAILIRWYIPRRK